MSLCALLMAACSYLLPATWRSFRIHPDEAGPAVLKALAAQQLDVAAWNVAKHEITSEYLFISDGIDRNRERYVVRWEHSEPDGTLIVYVRHQSQAQTQSDGRPAWGPTTHDSDKEVTLLEAITAELNRRTVTDRGSTTFR